MLPRKKQVDAVFGNEVAVSKKSEELMSEDKLGFVCIDVRDRKPHSVREEDPAGNDGMNMRIEF
jgi:hypothetical protein